LVASAEPLQTLLSFPTEGRTLHGQWFAGVPPSEGTGAVRNALEGFAHFGPGLLRMTPASGQRDV